MTAPPVQHQFHTDGRDQVQTGPVNLIEQRCRICVIVLFTLDQSIQRMKLVLFKIVAYRNLRCCLKSCKISKYTLGEMKHCTRLCLIQCIITSFCIFVCLTPAPTQCFYSNPERIICTARCLSVCSYSSLGAFAV